jgi:hypothetical protein
MKGLVPLPHIATPSLEGAPPRTARAMEVVNGKTSCESDNFCCV